MSRLDDLTKSLVDVYASQLNKDEQDTLLECLEILANDQKYNKFNNYYPDEGEFRRELYPKHISFFKAGAEWKERAFLAANRCISPWTFIETDCEKARSLEVFSEKSANVQSWDGTKKHIAQISGGILKGFEPMYRVVMDTGEFFDCTRKHRVLTSCGFADIDQIMSLSSGLHLKHTIEDYQASCVEDGYLCGQPLRPAQDISQEQVPLQVYAQGLVPLVWSLEDVKEQIYTHIRTLQFPVHLSSLGDYQQLVALFLPFSASKTDKCDLLLTQNMKEVHLLVSELASDFQSYLEQSHETLSSNAYHDLLHSYILSCANMHQQLCEKFSDAQKSYHSQDLVHGDLESLRGEFGIAKFYPLYHPPLVGGKRIVCVLPVGFQPILDATVDKYNCYFSAGVIHHNTGKSESGAFETTCHATGLYPSWWEGKRFDRPVLIWAGGDTATTVRDIIQKKLIGDDILDMGSGMIPKDTIIKEKCKTRRNVPDAMEILKIRHITGGESTIVLKTYEQGRATWQGTEVDFCIAEDSPVLMAEGYYKKIQDVLAGEYVMSVDKNRNLVPRKVVAVHDKGLKDAIEVSMKNGIWLKATPDHKVYDSVKNKHELQDVKRILQADLTQLTGGRSGCYPKVFYKLLGLYLAEGTFATRKITIGNEALMEGIISELPSEARIRKFTFNEKHNHVPDWTIYWDEFWSVIPKSVSSTKEIPDFVFCSVKDEIKEVIRYMYAGDGWASGKVIGYASTSRVLTEQLSLLLARFGIRGNIIKKNKQNEKWNDQWWLLISASEMVKLFCEEIGIPYKEEALAKVLIEAERRIASKSKRANHFKKDSVKHDKAYMKSRNILQKYGYSTVRKIENADIRHVYDLSVEGEHRFIVGTHVVSNCWVDEECPQDVYGEALIRLMTTKGSIITTFTPLNGITPLVLSFLDNSQETTVEFPRWVEICTWDDVPHLSEEEKAKTLANTPPQLRDARSKGIPTVGSGLIYPIEQKQITVADFQIPRHFQKLYGMDVGWKATAACWGAWDRDNDVIYIYSEYKRGGEEGLDMPLVHASTIKSRGEWIKGTIDPASRGRTQTDGEQLYMTYKKHGLKIYPAQNAVENGIFTVWERLNSGRLKIFSSCTMLLRELSLYHRDDNGKIVKTNDHLCLSKDTSVLTSEGFKKIIDCVGEETNLISYSGSIIKTNGAFKTQNSAALVEIKTSKGTLKCTDNHLLLSTDGLWYDASISEGIEISHLGEELCHYWSCQTSSKNSMEKHIGCVGGISSVTVEDYTLLYGNIISDKSQKAMLSTTLTVIDIITKSKTLPALLEESIQHSTIKSVLQKGLNLSFQKPLERLLLHGTNQMEARNGIESITKTLSICFTDVLSENVPFAVKYTKLLESIRQHLFVQTTANQLGEEQAVLTIFNAFVQFVAVNLLPTNILLAKHVQELAEENLQKEKILGVKRIGSEEVYCFSVAGYESFVVNGGMVVHNCDCLRYLCAAEGSMWSFHQQDNKQSKVIEMSKYMQACT